jgi:hypothetical protein
LGAFFAAFAIHFLPFDQVWVFLIRSSDEFFLFRVVTC